MAPSKNAKKSTLPMKVGWPKQIIYNDEVANVSRIEKNHAYYTLSVKYMNKQVILDKNDLKKYEKQVLDEEEKRNNEKYLSKK